MDNGFVSVVGVHQVHNGPVLAGYIKQVLNGLRVLEISATARPEQIKRSHWNWLVTSTTVRLWAGESATSIGSRRSIFCKIFFIMLRPICKVQ